MLVCCSMWAHIIVYVHVYTCVCIHTLLTCIHFVQRSVYYWKKGKNEEVLLPLLLPLTLWMCYIEVIYLSDFFFFMIFMVLWPTWDFKFCCMLIFKINDWNEMAKKKSPISPPAIDAFWEMDDESFLQRLPFPTVVKGNISFAPIWLPALHYHSRPGIKR